MICNKCGSENREGAKFCDECGNLLESNAELVIPPIEDNPHEVDGFDFSPLDESVPTPADESMLTEEIYPHSDHEQARNEADITSRYESLYDTRGIDEVVAGPGYVAPESAWDSGDTMQMPKVEGQGIEKKKEFKAPDASKKKKMSRPKKIVIGVLIALVVLVGGFSAAAFIDLPDGTNVADALGLSGVLGGKKIPDVTSLGVNEATDILEERGFKVKTMEVKSDEDEGLVLLMDPNAGTRKPEGETIILHISTARIVPDVIGKPIEEANAAFAKEGLDNVTIEKQKSNEPEGTVIQISPEPGVRTKSTAAVTVVIAEPFVVPDVIGMARADAVSILEGEGYQVHIVYVYSEASEGSVVASDPGAGTQHPSGALITLSIAKSRGSELVEASRSTYQAGGSFTIGGTSYSIVSVDSVEYVGNDTTVMVMTTSLSTTVNGEVLRGETKQRTFTVTWSQDNTPSIRI